jgi:mono/diheme cytochrome c family protein
VTLHGGTGRIAAAAWIALFVATPRAHAEDRGDPLLAKVGAEAFQTYCASCHGATAIGDGPAASALRTTPADLTRIAARRSGAFPDAEIARFIDGRFDLPAHGSREMPIWGERLGAPIAEGVDHDEVVRGKLLALLEYLKTIQRP